MRCLYTLFFYLLIPLIFVRLYIRGAKNPGYRQDWRQRFGYAPWRLKRCIWFHVVSLGESIAAQPVIEHLLQKYPQLPLLITNTTPTGRDYIRNKFGDRLHNCYFPYDTPCMLKRFIKRVRPCALLLMETELWPNLQHVCWKKNIPVAILNARLSARSFQKYYRFRRTSEKMMRAMQCVAAQYQTDADHFIQLGTAPANVHITGSIKFDMAVPKGLQQEAKKLQSQWQGRPVWIAASTHEGEDDVMLAAQQQVLQTIPDALLIIVPRHPERFAKVAQQAAQRFTVVTRSSGKPCTAKTQVYIGDTMGEMLKLYAASQIAVVAGSFKPIGGHNILEPALFGLPIITGPNMHNFAKISEMFVSAGASKIVTDAATLARTLVLLFQNADQRHEMGKAAGNIMEQNRGALKRLTACIDHLLEKATC